MQPRQCAVAALAVFLMLNVAAGVSAAGINWNQTYSCTSAITMMAHAHSLSSTAVQVTRFEDYIRKAFICNGTYTLCAYAQCRITSQSINSNTPIAECGCYNKRGLNLGAPPGILSWKVRQQVEHGITTHHTAPCSIGKRSNSKRLQPPNIWLHQVGQQGTNVQAATARARR